MITGKRVLITGSGGFIGSALVRRLALDNYVSCFDIAQGADILDEDELASAVAGQQVIIHAAAMLGVYNVHQDAIKTLDTNYNGTANVLRSALNDTLQCERVICFSTSEIFGSNANNVAENGTPMFPDAQDTRWCYGVGKLAAEHLAMGYYRQHGLPVVIIRPFNVFGPGRTGNHALLNFIQAALRGDDLIIYGNGTDIRAWCYIDDFCNAVLRTLEVDKAIGKAFNIGNPLNVVSTYQLAKMVVRLCRSKSRIVFQPAPFTDIGVRIPDIGLARSVLGYEPKVELGEGVLGTVEWVKDSSQGTLPQKALTEGGQKDEG